MKWMGWGVGVALFLAAAEAAEVEGLGRLFTTPAERAASAREGRVAGGPRLDGMVRGADGVVGVWIDGRRVAVGDALARGGRVVAVEGGGVVVERAGRRARLRVGERLEVGR